MGLESIPYPEGNLAASELVLSYLIHHGYSHTVRAFSRDSGSGQDSALELQLLDMQNRQSMCTHRTFHCLFRYREGKGKGD